MPLELVTVPCLKDNYAFLLHDPVSRTTAVVDVPEAPPIRAALAARGWQLTHVLLTHHHWDHVDGLADLIAGGDVRVIGAAADAHRLPVLDQKVEDGDTFFLGKFEVRVIDGAVLAERELAYSLAEMVMSTPPYRVARVAAT